VRKTANIIKAPLIDKEVIVVHHCSQESNIGEMTGLLKQISAQIYGNGHLGLSTTVPILSSKITEMSDHLTALSTNVSALMKYMAEDTGENRAVERARLSASQWTAIISSSIIALGAIVVTIILET
jgi:hypothetical protein